MNKKKEVRKKIIFYSFGASKELSRSYWPSELPEEKVSRFVFDIRDFILDPYFQTGKRLKGNGITSRAVKKFITEEVEAKGIFKGFDAFLKMILSSFASSKERQVCELYLYCAGGWQRSTFFVNHCKKFASEQFRTRLSGKKKRYKKAFDIQVKHLSMHEWIEKLSRSKKEK